MTVNKNTGRLLGTLFLLVMILWGAGFAILNPLINAPDYLEAIYPNQSKIMVGVLIELLEVVGVLGITFILFPILKRQSEVLALSYVGFRIFEAMMLVIALLCPLILITLSSQYIDAGVSEPAHFHTWGMILREVREDWSLFVLALFHPIAAMPLYLFFYRTRLIPRFISMWGFFAALWVLLDDVILESFGLGLGRINGNPIAGIPMGLNEIVLGVWLIIKGFDEKILTALNRKGSDKSIPHAVQAE